MQINKEYKNDENIIINILIKKMWTNFVDIFALIKLSMKFLRCLQNMNMKLNKSCSFLGKYLIIDLLPPPAKTIFN